MPSGFISSTAGLCPMDLTLSTPTGAPLIHRADEVLETLGNSRCCACSGLLLALSGHARCVARCVLSGVKRTSNAQIVLRVRDRRADRALFLFLHRFVK